MDRTTVEVQEGASPLLGIEAGFQKVSVEEESTQTGKPIQEVRYARFAALTANGSSPENSARIMGISVATSYRWLKVKSVAETVASMQAQVKSAGRRKLQRYQHEAIEVVYEVMLNAKMDKDKLAAAFGILDRTGLSVQELLQESNVNAAPVVIQQFMQFNSDAAERQAARAAMQMEAYEAEFKEGGNGKQRGREGGSAPTFTLPNPADDGPE